VKPFQGETPWFRFVLPFQLAQELFQRRSIETEIKRQEIRVARRSATTPQIALRDMYSNDGSPMCAIQ